MVKYDNFKKYKKDFYKTSYGESLKKRLDRLMVIGILGTIFSIFLFIFHVTIWDITSGIILLLASLFFIIESIVLRINKTNDYILKKK